jgi:uncharacterized protein YfdQ (DUF2303 family)
MSRTTPPETYTAGSTPSTEAAVVADLALAHRPVELVDVTDDDGKVLEQHVYGRDGDGGAQLLNVIDLEMHRDRPRATVGEVNVHTPQALETYADRFLDSEVSTLWGDVDNARLTIVLNDDTSSVPAHRDHRVVLKLKPSPEWTAWTAKNQEEFSQEALAEFIEENRHVIVSPSSSTMLEVAQTFQATSGAVFKRAQSLHSGEVRLTYEEDINAKAGAAGETEIPREFVVALRPFAGGDPVEVQAQFRFRVGGGKLILGYRLLNIDDVRRAAVEQILARVADTTGLNPIEGVAPGPRR